MKKARRHGGFPHPTRGDSTGRIGGATSQYGARTNERGQRPDRRHGTRDHACEDGADRLVPGRETEPEPRRGVEQPRRRPRSRQLEPQPRHLPVVRSQRAARAEVAEDRFGGERCRCGPRSRSPPRRARRRGRRRRPPAPCCRARAWAPTGRTGMKQRLHLDPLVAAKNPVAGDERVEQPLHVAVARPPPNRYSPTLRWSRFGNTQP